jgi:single-strand DNA-binding protein
MNLCVLVGRLGRDAELKYVNSRTPVCSFSLALNEKIRRGKGYEGVTTWLRVACWDKLAEQAGNLKKGELVLIEGSLRKEKWKTKTGEEREGLQVMCRHSALSTERRFEDIEHIGLHFQELLHSRARAGFVGFAPWMCSTYSNWQVAKCCKKKLAVETGFLGELKAHRLWKPMCFVCKCLGLQDFALRWAPACSEICRRDDGE